MEDHDKRLHAVRPNLADSRLKGKVRSERFVEGRPMQVSAGVADVLSQPRPDAGLQTQFLAGEQVRMFDMREGWAWVQGESDGYVGYVAADALGEVAAATHVVAVPRTFTYRGADLKLPRTGALSMGCRLRIVGEAQARGTRYGMLATGEALVLSHLRPVGQVEADFVAVAETLIHTPYLWGGASGFGIDCSGLVQLSMRMAGRSVLRDTDMQAASLGEPVPREELRRGDLVFWKGHVAIMLDPATIIHANGHTMSVALEGLDAAIARIGYLYGQPTEYRRG